VRLRSGAAGLLLAAVLAAPASAQFGGTPTEAEVREARAEAATPDARSVAQVSGPVDAATYVLGPGDVLRLIFSGPFTRLITAEIGPEGSMLVPDYGPVRVGGMTLTAARAEVRRRVGAGMRGNVHLDLELARVRLLRVFLAGDVTEPGAVELPATARVSDALGGGARLAASGSRRNVELRHRDGSTERADLDRFVRLADGRANPLLRDDDVVFVPPVREWIHVSGAVAHEGRFELSPGDSLRRLLELGGGLLGSARRERALFVRWTGPATRESLVVDAGDIASGIFSPELRDGDRLLVYHLPEYHRFEAATIIGEVTSPGVYPLVHGTTRLSDLVRAAGGFQPRANLAALHVQRPRRNDPATDSELERLSRLSRNEMTSSEYEVLRTRLTQGRADFRVDWNRLGRVPDTDILLMDGDIVRVDPMVASVRVEGQVRRPGLVRYDAGSGLSRYVENAGGFSGRAARSQTLVTRALTGQTLPAREVEAIEPGDLIWVPERPDRTLWQNFGTLITVAAQVATIVIAVRR
jgi:protein involved in polysaccharide export with SLBB domain